MASYPDSTTINWALTGVAGGLSVGRYVIRALYTRRLYWDDGIHMLAFLLLIAHGITQQYTDSAKANLQVVLKGTPEASEDELLGIYKNLYNLNTSNNCLMYMVFWAVKVSFMMFYRFLFDVSATFRKMWWAVLVFTLLSFWVPVAGVIATCNDANTLADYAYCNSANFPRIQKLQYTCVINVLSDVAIMALPLGVLHGLKLRLPQKLGLAFVFSIAIVIVALDILRTVEAIDNNQNLYTILEINFTVIISCLPVYRSLLSKINQRRSSGWSSRKSGGESRSLNLKNLDSRKADDYGHALQSSVESNGGEGNGAMVAHGMQDIKGYSVTEQTTELPGDGPPVELGDTDHSKGGSTESLHMDKATSVHGNL